MELLIFTQKVDLNDTVLSFFHRWILEIAKHFEQVTVICLYKGKCELPANIRVLSLGKENGESKFKYLKNFYKYIIKYRKDYDAVFVHMNQEYMILGGIIWKIMGKKAAMWRNHHAGSWLTDLAAFFCFKVFCTSRYSFTAKYKKTVLMPVGVDTELFVADKGTRIQREERSILSLGRISISKRLEYFVDALGRLARNAQAFHASIYGDALPKDQPYYEMLKKKTEELQIADRVAFCAGIPNDETPAVYSRHNIFVNLSSSGMYDKTIFEAMSCECVVLVSNENLHGLIDEQYIFKDRDTDEFTEKLSALISMPEDIRREKAKELRRVVESKHSLGLLANKIRTEYN